MEADHFRTHLFQHPAGGIIERRAVGHRGWRVEVDAQFLVIRLEPLLPGRGPLFVEGRRLVTEKIHIERFVGLFADGRQRPAQLFDIKHRRRHRTQPAGIAGRDHHGRPGHSGQRPLDDGQLDTEQVKNASVWPLAHVRGLRGQKETAFLAGVGRRGPVEFFNPAFAA
ncbi:hypothetical protein D3C84_726210 [compost metagenome]